jgi:hypothetical protein
MVVGVDGDTNGHRIWCDTLLKLLLGFREVKSKSKINAIRPI